jgi:hypothetical protein
VIARLKAYLRDRLVNLLLRRRLRQIRRCKHEWQPGKAQYLAGKYVCHKCRAVIDGQDSRARRARRND